MHFNQKRCASCADALVKRPRHALTLDQQLQAKQLAGTIYRREIAERIGSSLSAITRFAADNPQLNWNAHKHSESVVAEVCEYYLAHSLDETRKKFPHIKVRSIIDRYLKQSKIRTWTDDEIVELYKLTGLVSWREIAIKLNRSENGPRKFKERKISGRINGLIFDTAKHFVRKGCPFYPLKLHSKATGMWISPWICLEKYLKDTNPEWVNEAFRSLAKFQRWLHGSEERIFEIIEGKL